MSSAKAFPPRRTAVIARILAERILRDWSNIVFMVLFSLFEDYVPSGGGQQMKRHEN
jgi:hypothetical protein